ncbi:hypothetical protein, partial [Viridibacillus soli]|uniref:hypothetical protein n=1 Tax=Viridibacillus soli TaxID=2798301 RepID=UPI001F1C4380
EATEKVLKDISKRVSERFIVHLLAFLNWGAVDLRSRRTRSAGMASASSSLRSCGVFTSCYSGWSRRLPLQSTSICLPGRKFSSPI